MEKYHKF